MVVNMKIKHKLIRSKIVMEGMIQLLILTKMAQNLQRDKILRSQRKITRKESRAKLIKTLKTIKKK